MIWDLNDDQLNFIGLDIIEKRKYEIAKNKWESDNNELVLNELKQYQIECLSEKFLKKKITMELIWDLDDDLLNSIGLDPIEKKKYEIAKKKWESDNTKNISQSVGSLSLSGRAENPTFLKLTFLTITNMTI